MTLPTTQEYERQREFERWLDSNAVLSSIPGDGLEGLPSCFSQSVHAMSLAAIVVLTSIVSTSVSAE
jgi:hypothetical protein